MARYPANAGLYRNVLTSLISPLTVPHARQPIIGITLGDPAGIGPEIIELARSKLHTAKATLRIIGTTAQTKPGKPSKKSASLSLRALHEAIALLKRGEIQAIVTGPVCKENLARIGFHYPGQTEFFADQFGIPHNGVTMMFLSKKLRVSLVTIHCSLREAVRKINLTTIHRTIAHTHQLLNRIGFQAPRIALCGLNPHAGENGLFGKEEQTIIAPAIASFHKQSPIHLSGPHSADTVFLSALHGKYDAVIAMYHDQGLIPLKLVAFDSGVNLTLGLPIWRTSPDHGTAFDIAGTGKASPASMVSAIQTAIQLAHSKHLS